MFEFENCFESLRSNDKVVSPILLDLFVLVLKTFGPKAPGERKCLSLTPAQTSVAADIEETLALFAGPVPSPGFVPRHREDVFTSSTPGATGI